MFKWLHSFFYSDDEVVKLAAGLGEPEAEMMRGLLESNGIAAMIKNMNFLSVDWGRPLMPAANNFDLFVKQSDVESALDIIGPTLEDAQLAKAALEAREGRRGPRR